MKVNVIVVVDDNWIYYFKIKTLNKKNTYEEYLTKADIIIKKNSSI